MNEVAVVVVNFRTPALTIACVESVLASTGVDPTVFIVDSRSGDDSVERFHQRFGDDHRVIVAPRDRNDGYSGAANTGIVLAGKARLRYCLVLNSDTTVSPACVSLLLDAVRDGERVAAAVPRIFLGPTDEVLWYDGGSYSLWRGRPIHHGFRQRAAGRHPSASDVTFASGCAILVDIEALGDAPLFDATLFAYAEDVDLSLRLLKQGYRLRFVPEAVVHHLDGGSHRPLGGDSLRFYFTTRNLLRVAAKHAHWYQWLVLAPSLAIDVIARFCVATLRDGDRHAFIAVLEGARDAVSGGRHAIESTRARKGAPATERKSRS